MIYRREAATPVGRQGENGGPFEWAHLKNGWSNEKLSLGEGARRDRRGARPPQTRRIPLKRLF